MSQKFSDTHLDKGQLDIWVPPQLYLLGSQEPLTIQQHLVHLQAATVRCLSHLGWASTSRSSTQSSHRPPSTPDQAGGWSTPDKEMVCSPGCQLVGILQTRSSLTTSLATTGGHLSSLTAP